MRAHERRPFHGAINNGVRLTRYLALGSTVPELNMAPLGNLHLGTFEKTMFSMAIPPVTALLQKHDLKSIVLFGIEVRDGLATYIYSRVRPQARGAKTGS